MGPRIPHIQHRDKEMSADALPSAMGVSFLYMHL